jgi:hypothetical protein
MKSLMKYALKTPENGAHFEDAPHFCKAALIAADGTIS